MQTTTPSKKKRKVSKTKASKKKAKKSVEEVDSDLDVNRIMSVPVELLVHADWNYKTDGTPEQIEKLMRSISKDKSAGVLAVREIKVKGKKKFEVIDGNHRLTGIQGLKWKTAYVENFGDISKATAITITRRRNHNWFEDDLLKLSNLFKDVVIPEISLEELEDFMPDSLEEMQNLLNLGSFDWETPEQKVQKQDSKESTEEEASDGMSKNKMHISLRVTNTLGRKMERFAKEEKFTNLEEFAVECIQQYIKMKEAKAKKDKGTKVGK